MARILYLFPDTNLLIQCRPLAELGWGQWKEFDEIHVLISRPVQKEIDKHKNGGSGRLAKRGRMAASLLRDVITESANHKVIREASPRVKLFVRIDIKPSPALAETLDYGEPDDRLVGTVHSFMSQNPDCDARVFTHDSGPVASAKASGVKVEVIPDEWLLPPEQSEADKRIKSLETEVARLKQVEPAFDITCLDVDGNACERLEFEVTSYEAISEGELADLIARLKKRFPIATDFGARERSERGGRFGSLALAMNVKEVFIPATDKEIGEYRAKYASWLEECEARLRSLHDALQRTEQPPFFAFRASNDGTRPAEDALVEIVAKGQFSIAPPPYHRDDEKDDDEIEDEQKDEGEVKLPDPPDAPRGSWKVEHYSSVFGNLEVLRSLSAFATPVEVRSPFRDLLRRQFNLPTPRDPNEFYHKPERPEEPVGEFSLACRQWRHGVEPVDFVGQVFFAGDAETISGALECRIHAANASEVQVKLVPIEIRATHVKAAMAAKELVERLGSSL